MARSPDLVARWRPCGSTEEPGVQAQLQEPVGLFWLKQEESGLVADLREGVPSACVCHREQQEEKVKESAQQKEGRMERDECHGMCSGGAVREVCVGPASLLNQRMSSWPTFLSQKSSCSGGRA